MQRVARAVAVLSLTALGLAQTSPVGMENREGNSRQWFWTAGRRYQQVDQAVQGTPLLIRSLSFRRDRDGGGGGPGHQVEVSGKLATCPFATLSANLDLNLRHGVSSFVRPLALPDWRTAPISPPAAFDLQIPLPVAYPYSGQIALVVDLTITQSNFFEPLVMDRDFVAPWRGLGEPLGYGCIATGRNGPFRHLLSLENSGPALGAVGMRLIASGQEAPAGASFLGVGSHDSKQSVPGLCALLRANPLLLLDLGPADALGRLPARAFSFPYDPSIHGQSVVTQLFALDPGQATLPIAVSDGMRATMPANYSSQGHRCANLSAWAPSPLASQIDFGGGAVIRLDR